MNLREITITVFEEIVLIVIQLEFVCQTSAVVHSTVDMHFEFSHALSNWCQIKTNVTNLCNHLHLHADKNFSVKPLSVKWIASVLCSRYLLKIVQFMQVSFCDNLFRFKNKNVIHQPRSVHIGKNCAYCLVHRLRPLVLGHNFFQIRTDVGWWITHIFHFPSLYVQN